MYPADRVHIFEALDVPYYMLYCAAANNSALAVIRLKWKLEQGAGDIEIVRT